MGSVADFDKIPDWLHGRLRDDVEGSIDGVRWVSDGVVAMAVAGPTWHVLPGLVSNAVAGLIKAPPPKSLGAYVIEVHEAGKLAPHSEKEPRAGIESAGNYQIAWPAHDIAIALYYAAAVHKLYGAVEWRGSGPLGPVVALVDGAVVAVVMPVRRLGSTSFSLTVAEASAAPPEATAVARGEA